MKEFLYFPLFLLKFKAIITQPLVFFEYYYALVNERPGSFFDIHSEREGDNYLSPVKFAALAIVISNLIFPITLALGVDVGAVDPGFARFVGWAEDERLATGFSVVGIGFVDEFICKVLMLLMFYVLGVLIFLFSNQGIPVAFSAGYFFYWNAWSLLSSIATLAMVLISYVIPLYSIGVATVVDGAIYIAGFFMMLVFPLWFWPRITGASRKRVVVAFVAGFAAWLATIAIVAPLIVQMPEF